jgi:hypothetical protein
LSDASEFADRDPADEPANQAASRPATGPEGFTVADTPPDPLDGLAERAASDSGAPFKPDVLAALGDLRRTDRAAFETLRGRLKKAGVRVAALDNAIAAEAGSDDNGGALKQGRALSLPAPEPWPEPVDGAELLDRLAAFYTRHVFLPAGAADAMAAWAVHTHCFDLFRHSSRLAFTSPEKRCGKTTALDATALVCCKPLPTANVTAAAVFRTIEVAGPTLLIDEADTFLRDNEDLRGILNAGHKRGGQVIRCVGDDAEPRAFAVYAPAAIAAIGRLPGTITDRAIEVRMKRATRTERPEPLRAAAEAEGAELARRCARWVADHIDNLRDADPALPAGLFNRAADNWRPPFAIAEAAGGGWPQRLAMAAVALAPDDDDAEGRGVRLLSDVRAIFNKQERAIPDKREGDKLSSAYLCETLAADATGQWADYKHGKPIRQAQLANALKPFGIIPGSVRIGTATPKGYERAAFAESWSRYLPAPEDASPAGKWGTEPQHRHNSQKSRTSAPSWPATATNRVAGRNACKLAPATTCGGVAASGADPTVDGKVEGEL